MRSRRYAIFKNGFESLAHENTIIGPENANLVFRALTNFWVPYFGEKGAEYCFFAAQSLIDEPPGGNKIECYFMVENPPIIEKTVLRKLYPDFDDVFEWFNEGKIEFCPVFVPRKLENLAWGY